MKWPVECIGCTTKLREGDSAIHATHTDDDGLTTRWSMCEPCVIRFHRDPAFAARFDDVSAVLTGSIKA